MALSLNLNENNSISKLISEFNNVCNIIYKCNGKVFGGFVRDFLYKYSLLTENEKSTFTPKIDFNDFKDIDVWVKTKEDKDKLIKMLTENEYITFSDIQQLDGTLYPFNIYKYTISKNREWFTFLDIVVSEFYPVNDFSINLLSYDGKEFNVENPCILIAKNYNTIISYTKDEIIKQIINRYTYILPDFKVVGSHIRSQRIDKFQGVKNIKLMF